jgi:hypothetical protein
MEDKSLSILLMVLFGGAGITILTLVWLRPMPGLERGLATFIGALGLLVALSRGLLLKSAKAEVKVEVQDKP